MLNIVKIREEEINKLLLSKYKLSQYVVSSLEQEERNLNSRQFEIEDNLKILDNALIYIEDVVYRVRSGKITNEEQNNEYQKLKTTKDLLDKIVASASILNVIPVFNLKESTSMWKLSSSNFTEGLQYIKKNGRLLNNVNDIENSKVRYIVKETLKKYELAPDIKGIILNKKSGMAFKIRFSQGMRDYLRKNRDKIKPNTSLPDATLEFKFINFDLYNALHLAKIFNVYVDFKCTLTAKILDTYDFNKKDPNVLVKTARKLQEANMIENYFTITEISLPDYLWKFLSQEHTISEPIIKYEYKP